MSTNLQKNPKKQFIGSKQAILQKEPNKHVLNNTTVQHLGNGEEPIEVFPPEIFFKGKNLAYFWTILTRQNRYNYLNFDLNIKSACLKHFRY